MRIDLTALVGVAALASGGQALADGPVVATLATPFSSPVKLIAAHAVFECAETTCRAALAPDDAQDVSACQTLAKQVGRLLSYTAYRPLGDNALEACNTAAPKTEAVSRHR
jgi:hypothetical protein